ncbi:MAG: DNA polymerase III subunit alpha, partial [Treponema sp.]|nr:DNA polymerase III subunit alpha [Treponema sp.]
VPRDFGKAYTVVGMIVGIHEHTTKNGEKMGFGTLQDYDGTLDLTFFKSEWAELKDKLVVNGVYAFSGRVDSTRDTPSFIVSKLEDPQVLKERAYTEIHIQLESGFKTEDDVSRLREFLLKGEGRCSLFLHVDTERESYIIRANQQLTANPTKDFLDDVKSLPFIKDAWAS